MENTKKFYQCTWFIILSLILFFPLGVFLMWKYSKWNKAVRVVFTVFFAFIFLIIIIPSPSVQNDPASQNASSEPKQSESQTTTKEPNDTVVSKPQQADTKKIAKETDEKINKIIIASETSTGLLQQGIDLVAKGEGSLLELYDLAKKVKDNQDTAFGLLLDIKDDSAKNYLDAAQYYVINAKRVPENLIKYIDKEKMSYLSDAKEALSNTTNYAIKFVTARMEYLLANGFTQDEVNAMLEAK